MDPGGEFGFKKSTFAVLFPQGRVEVTQRAGFDLELGWAKVRFMWLEIG